jgi:hypothetical protein
MGPFVGYDHHHLAVSLVLGHQLEMISIVNYPYHHHYSYQHSHSQYIVLVIGHLSCLVLVYRVRQLIDNS